MASSTPEAPLATESSHTTSERSLNSEAPPAAASGRPGEALKWRIDVEDYVSEDNASVVDDILEGLNKDTAQDTKLAADAMAVAAAAAAAASEQAKATKEDSQAPRAGADLAPAPAAAGPTVAQEAANQKPTEMAVAGTENPSLAGSMDLASLYTLLKETRDRPVTSAEDTERKAQEVAALQSALKEARIKATPGAPTEIPESFQPDTVDLAKTQSVGPAYHRSVPDGTAPVRRVASAGPPEGLMTSDMISGYGALSTAPSPSPSPRVRPVGQSASGGMATADQRAMKARTMSRTSYASGPPPLVHTQSQTSLDPRVDPRQTMGFSEAQARAMGLIQGPTAASHAEPRADDVAHMQWKAHHGSSVTPSSSARSGYQGQYQGQGSGDAASVVDDRASAWDGYRSRAGSVYGGDSQSVYDMQSQYGGDARSAYGDARSAYGDARSAYGDARSAYGDARSVYGDDRSVYGDESRAIVPAPVKKSPWRTNEMPQQIYKGQQMETQEPIVDHSDAYSTVSGAYFRAPTERSVPPSEAGDMPVALTYTRSNQDSRKASALSRRLGQLSLLGDEGVTVPDIPEQVIDDTKSVKSAMTAVSAPPPKEPPPVGTIDVQMFTKLVREMREEGANIAKLKQQNKLLQGWYGDSKAWADEKSLRALEAMIIADDAEDVAAMKHKLLKDLDERLVSLKDKMAGIVMLEQENQQLRGKLHQMTNTKAPDSLLSQLKGGSKADLLLLNVLPGSNKNAKKDLENLAAWMEELQEDGGQVERLKKLNRLLQGWYADANSRAEDAIAREREEFKRAKEAEELAAASDLLILEMEAKHSEMRMKLAARQMLEQENRELRSKITALSSSRGPNVPVQKQQAILLEALEENLGFSQGRPIMACIVYKAMVHWSMIEVERMNTFDCVMEIQDRQCKEPNPDIHSYWISNAVHMLFLATRGPTRIDSSVAKTQLSSTTSRLYLTIRDNVKDQLTSIINNLLQPPPMPVDDNMTEVGSVVSGATSVLHKLVPSAGNVRRQMAAMWENVIGALRQLVDVLRANYVPPYIVRELLSQLLQFVDLKLFNAIMMHSPWVPCTLTNAETMDAGIQDLEDWLSNVDEWLNSTLKETISLHSSLAENICHVKEATTFLLDDNKPKRSLRGIQRLCHHLSMTQLAHICTWFEDDKEGLPGVEPHVIEQMWSLMHEDQPFLLKEDKSCPFTGEEVCRSMKEFALDDIEPPERLQQEDSFHFLVPVVNPASEYERF